MRPLVAPAAGRGRRGEGGGEVTAPPELGKLQGLEVI